MTEEPNEGVQRVVHVLGEDPQIARILGALTGIVNDYDRNEVGIDYVLALEFAYRKVEALLIGVLEQYCATL